MTVRELCLALEEIGYVVPMEMFTLFWSRKTVQRVNRYYHWKRIKHHSAGHPALEPPMLVPFKVHHGDPEIIPELPKKPKKLVVCWTLTLAPPFKKEKR